MSLASAWAVALYGIDGVLVEIEAHIGPGLPGLQMVIRRGGQRSPELSTAARTRSRASDKAVSGSPTICNPGSPGPM